MHFHKFLFVKLNYTESTSGCRKENEMWCELRTKACALPWNAGRICLYLSEVGQHVGTSFTHLSEEDDGCVENTCGTGRRAKGRDALYRLNHHCSSTCSDYRMPVFVLKVDVKREKWLKKWFRLHRHESALNQIGNRKGNNLYSDYYKRENQVKNRVCVFYMWPKIR